MNLQFKETEWIEFVWMNKVLIYDWYCTNGKNMLMMTLLTAYNENELWEKQIQLKLPFNSTHEWDGVVTICSKKQNIFL